MSCYYKYIAPFYHKSMVLYECKFIAL